MKSVPEVASIYCATANPCQVLLVETEQGRGILGVVDGVHTTGLEDESGVAWRVNFLRKIGYKAG
jgi:adenosine/AMP kinase